MISNIRKMKEFCLNLKLFLEQTIGKKIKIFDIQLLICYLIIIE